jgi:aryl-alcohol dehydrogenase-like predicted oxidoreductase
MSQLGQRYELPTSESERLVRHALDAGVNMIDTAPGYGNSEAILGEALKNVPRDQYYLSTKFQPHATQDTLSTAADLRASLERSLEALRTDYVDLFYLHGIGPEAYKAVTELYLPELNRAKQQGLIKSIGITERYQSDHAHAMALEAIEDGDYDVLMVGLNVMSPAAVTSVLPRAGERNVGIVVMCAVRSVLVKPAAVEAYVRQWQEEGLLEPGLVEPRAALDWLIDAQAPTVSAAAYKFAAMHPAVGSVLTGTASREHFDENLHAILGSPLAEQKYQRVLDMFGPVQRNVQPERSGQRRG